MSLIKIDNLPPQLFSYLGLNHLTPDQQMEILEQIKEVISNRLLEKLIDRLDLATADKLALAYQKNDSAIAMEILKIAVPDLAKIIAAEITAYISELTMEVNK
ncbi:MAG: hypothetical protein UV05_C0020G0007 [candidate division CPR1 bacterium GW2011_GWA2_42_17]|uniref:Uncharacterized protein n=1 Tax=candidate division CPR1 bacterium GW2011_GWA2_42_17 TaxID=1618341 RepID=A0A0G1BBS7_9BACT|nr:MAG: hypothetical protein UV05_C0020G0007 [candidate division CPR1 bacterium GW2011_GWA2_42_17]